VVRANVTLYGEPTGVSVLKREDRDDPAWRNRARDWLTRVPYGYQTYWARQQGVHRPADLVFDLLTIIAFCGRPGVWLEVRSGALFTGPYADQILIVAVLAGPGDGAGLLRQQAWSGNQGATCCPRLPPGALIALGLDQFTPHRFRLLPPWLEWSSWRWWLPSVRLATSAAYRVWPVPSRSDSAPLSRGSATAELVCVSPASLSAARRSYPYCVVPACAAPTSSFRPTCIVSFGCGQTRQPAGNG
jgi:hypothetical protein